MTPTATRRTCQTFAAGVAGSVGAGPYGATTDPLTGDILVLSRGRAFEITGFSVPEPAGSLLVPLAIIASAARRPRSKEPR